MFTNKGQLLIMLTIIFYFRRLIMTKILNISILAIVLTTTSNIAFANNEARKKNYEQICSACHKYGVSGAPKFGDAAAWAPRIATGKAALYTSAINGKGAMPAKGGLPSLSDEVIKATVDYMVSNAK